MGYVKDYHYGKEIYKDAYFKVVKIITSYLDYEEFENVNDPENPDIAQRLTYKKRYQNHAIVYIWENEDCRLQRVLPINHFKMPFTFDPESDKNIYQQAYVAVEVAVDNWNKKIQELKDKEKEKESA